MNERAILLVDMQSFYASVEKVEASPFEGCAAHRLRRSRAAERGCTCGLPAR